MRIEPRVGGGWRFLNGGDFELNRLELSSSPEDLQTAHEARGIHIDRNTAATRWRGERMDYDLGVWVLCNQAERARNPKGAGDPDVSAGTFDG